MACRFTSVNQVAMQIPNRISSSYNKYFFRADLPAQEGGKIQLAQASYQLPRLARQEG